MSEFSRSHWIRRFSAPANPGKQKPVGVGRKTPVTSLVLLFSLSFSSALSVAGSGVSGAPLQAAGNAEDSAVVRPYDLYDPRFCYLTPRPFICERCLKSGQQFVQRLSFEGDGRPVRIYGCRPYSRKYLN